MFSRLRTTFLALCLTGAALPACAQTITLGPKIGTTGIGFQAAVPILPGRLDLLSGFSTFSYTTTIHVSNMPYHAKLNLGDVPLLLQYYPFHGRFHIDTGIYLNENRLSVALVTPTDGIIRLDHHNFTSAEIGSLAGSTHFNPVAPYLGIGFGNEFAGSRLTLTMNLGVMYEGPPRITLKASNPAILALPSVNQAVLNDQRELNNKARIAEFYPILNVGILFRF
jgi:hypothetical protein